MVTNQEQKVIEAPWGTWEILYDHPNYKVKRIVVKPLKRLSYQKHSKREEEWSIVAGEAEVTLNDEIYKLKTGENIRIAVGDAHRIKNSLSDQDLEFIEIQRGTYFGEDDIIRLEDDFGRV